MTTIKKQSLVEHRYQNTFVIVTLMFALWGFANDITNPLVAVFQTVMEISAAKASLVQFAFYGGYATMAIPAALFIRRFSYKSGIMVGLAFYAIGAFMFIPAANNQNFSYFCVSLYILTFGLAFLETSANPYILSLGTKATSTRRLNFAQAFNPVGSLMGMAVASFLVLPNLMSDVRDSSGAIIFPSLSEAQKSVERIHDLAIIRDPYVAIGVVALSLLMLIAVIKMPRTDIRESKLSFGASVRRLARNRKYRNGVATQMFYVAAQIMVWTFIIQYADRLGINKATAQCYNIVAMCLSLSFRFIGTYIMKYVSPHRLLSIFGVGASVCTIGTIVIDGMSGLWCLVAVSAFMSIMFPSIYGIALENVSERDTSLGAAFLVMSIVGGALMPPLQGAIIDMGEIGNMPAVNVSFVLPLACFAIVTAYGMSVQKKR